MRLIILISFFIVSAFTTAVSMKTSGLAFLLNYSRFVSIILIAITCMLSQQIAFYIVTGGRLHGNRARHNDI
ncbi:fission protein MTP18 [Paenibacillus sp. NAIST15-1]|nr:fission protein MTP18 [Paenibacillus sp. NAIST15-1]